MPDDIAPHPLPASHPINDPTPTWVHAVTGAMLSLLKRITDTAAHESKTVPSQTGFYPITLLADAKGNVLCDEAGVPVVVRAPVDVLAIAPDGRTVFFAQPNKPVKRSEAAEIAGVSISTLKRAEANGELRAFKIGERDTSYLMCDLNGWMFKRLLPDDLK
jgi:hypothetical protein